ncbi:unnamed protein product [Cuscuta campestris]|uniref:Uncharacterized protein n=1 Tax=Cuscuta campestris TaxID=132261 RepID=A0A484LPS3_9ASTE|nr:unnamed protein product [Cuscuta campestris]
MEGGSDCILGNKYWVLRHGKSIPNELGLIVSSMENGILEKYGLAPAGIEQARSAGDSFWEELKRNKIELEKVRICHSPFSRTSHTAQAVASRLPSSPQLMVIDDLRERYFGPSYELMSHEKYPEIWALDEGDPFARPDNGGGESVADVVSRLANALTTIESAFQGCAVLIVSHGDPLQILQTVLKHSIKVEAAAKESSYDDRNHNLASRVHAAFTAAAPSVLSHHRMFSLQTGELRAIP